MVAIAPFRALRYAPGTDLTKVTSPPHDCIRDEEVPGFHALDAHNVCHAILPANTDGEDDENTHRHARAAALIQAWHDEQVMVRDAKPGYYLYQIEWGPAEARRVMTGFFCRVKLDPTYTEIRRHEHTLAKKRSDRLKLLQATDINTESIWLLYRDERGWVEELLKSNAFEELAKFTDEEGHAHTLSFVNRDEAVAEITAQFDDRHLVIADGHHRYATSLKRHAETGRDEDGSMLVCLVRDTDPGIAILPTHRMVSGLGMDAGEAVAKATAWNVEDAPVDALPEDDRTCIVVGRGEEGLRAWKLRLKDDATVEEGRGTLDALAVTRVHDRLLRDAWGITPDHVEEQLKFTQRDDIAREAVAAGACDVAVMLYPESPHAVLDVSEEGQLMPQKATYFVPKLRSGLVMSPCDEPLPTKWSDTITDGGKADFRMPSLD